jgi:hypothetical protein
MRLLTRVPCRDDDSSSTRHSSEEFMREIVNRIRQFDQRRPGFPGEHFIVAALGTSLLNASRRRSGVWRLLAMAAGGALLARAASGRDGLARLKQKRYQ